MTWHLVRHALSSRALVLLLTWLIGRFWTAFDESVSLSHVSPHLHGFLRWDGIFDVAIAQYRYRYEQEYAFGPFYPFLVRQVAALCRRFSLFKLELGADATDLVYRVPRFHATDATRYTLSGILVSNVAFLLAALVLYRLTCSTWKDTVLCVMLMCTWLSTWTQCSTYSSKEPVLALLSFAGFYAFERQHDLIAVIAFILAALTRSNGVLLGGFFLHRALSVLLASRDEMSLSRRLVTIATSSLFGILPYGAFAAHQAWSAKVLCTQLQRPYCDYRGLSSYLLPKLHGFVQSTYWHVGPLRYWHTGEMGNWLLASGFLLLSLTSLHQYYTSTWRTLPEKSGQERMVHCLVGPRSCYYHHWTLFVLYLMVMSHIQVITRVFMSLPAVWWGLADRYWDAKAASTRSRWRQWAFWYGSVGLVLYATFYPPA